MYGQPVSRRSKDAARRSSESKKAGGDAARRSGGPLKKPVVQGAAVGAKNVIPIYNVACKLATKLSPEFSARFGASTSGVDGAREEETRSGEEESESNLIYGSEQRRLCCVMSFYIF